MSTVNRSPPAPGYLYSPWSGVGGGEPPPMDEWAQILSVVSDIARVLTFALHVGRSFFAKKKRPDSE